MIRRLPLIIMLVVLIGNAASGQETDKLATKGLGLSAGVVSGSGFSYRYLPEKGLGLNASIIGWDVGDNSFFHLGVEPLYVLKNSGHLAMYLVGGWALVSTDKSSDQAYGMGLGFAWRRFAWWPNEQFWTSLDLVVTAFRGNILPYPQFAVHYMLW